jgi:hypothetical protein
VGNLHPQPFPALWEDGRSAVAGAGFGLAFLGSFRVITALPGPDDRAGLVATLYVVGYLVFSVPPLIAEVCPQAIIPEGD